MGIGVRGFYIKIDCSDDFLDFSLYGSWEDLDYLDPISDMKTMSQGVPTFSAIENLILNFVFWSFFEPPPPPPPPPPGPGRTEAWCRVSADSGLRPCRGVALAWVWTQPWCGNLQLLGTRAVTAGRGAALGLGPDPALVPESAVTGHQGWTSLHISFY